MTASPIVASERKESTGKSRGTKPARVTRGAGSERLRTVLVTILGVIILLVLWQLTSMYLLKPVWISSPALVAGRFVSSFQDGTLVSNTVATTEEALIGLVAGMVVGILVGIALAEWRPVARILDPYIVGANSLPRIALAPFFVIWFGIGLFSKVVLVVSVVMFIALFNVRQGMASIDPDLVDVMKSMKAKRWAMFRYVTLPSLLPWIMSAVKIGIGSAIISAVVAEMVGADHGLGWSVTFALQEFDMTGAVTSMIMMVILAMILYGLLALLERWLFRWKGDGIASSVAPM